MLQKAVNMISRCLTSILNQVMSVVSQTYHRVRRAFLCESCHIGRTHTEYDREVGRERHVQTEPKESCPHLLRIDLADHCRSNDGYGKVGDEEVSPTVREKGRAAGRQEHEDELECCRDHLDE